MRCAWAVSHGVSMTFPIDGGPAARNPHIHLAAFGWTPLVAVTYEACLRTITLPAKVQPLAEPARVLAEHYHTWQVALSGGLRDAELSGLFAAHVLEDHDRPKVGDWVVATCEGLGRAVIHAVLPRSGVLVRRSAGNMDRDQLLAANVDCVFIVSGLDHDHNPRRIERYLILVRDGGSDPIVVLNKRDLCDNVPAHVAEVAAVAGGAPIVAISAISRVGLAALSPFLAPGRTVAVLGSSGAGKSSLVNALLDDDRQVVGAVRSDDARGRHTTTARALIPLPGGAVIIDTPGMREVGLAVDSESVARNFTEIAELAPACRFRDCTHQHEPGCAVLAAVESGDIPAERVAGYAKLMREVDATRMHRQYNRHRRARLEVRSHKRSFDSTQP